MANSASKVKRAAIQSAGQGNPRFLDFADHVVSPSHNRPILAPSLCPARGGAVTYPLVVEVSGMTDFCVIVSPDIHAPLMISHPNPIPESGTSVNGKLSKDAVTDACAPVVERGCDVEAISLDGRECIPFTSAAGCTLQVRVAVIDGQYAAYTYSFWTHAAGVWTNRGSANIVVGMGDVALPAIAFSILNDAFAFTLDPLDGGFSLNSDPYGTAHAAFTVNLTAGTASCATTFRQNVFDVFYPEWSKVLTVADKYSIPFMDCLITYQGSTLNNQGAIAVAATSEEIIPSNGDYYPAVASRPFDMYEGRLAANGATEGGAHWHLLHDDIRAYSLSATEEQITGPRGYFAIKGMDPTQPVRIMVHLTLNYYTIDPSFAMVFQPPWGEMDLLLYIMRTQVPVVSSNDGHLAKVAKLARRKAVEAGKWAYANPEQAVAMAMKGAALLAL